MDPATLIAAGSSLFGGLFGKKDKSVKQNTMEGIYGQAEAAVKAGAEWGFNPLTLLGASSPMAGSQSANYMGDAVANAGLLLADGIQQRQAGKRDALQAENTALKEKVQNLTLRPDTGGVYARRQSTPTLRSALGVKDAAVDRWGARGGAGSQNPGGDFDRHGELVEPRATNTYQTYINDGQATDVPLGPDLDEVITGVAIATNNKVKARRAERARTDMTHGTPLGVPWGVTNRIWELMPPSRPKAHKAPVKNPPLLDFGSLYRKGGYMPNVFGFGN